MRVEGRHDLEKARVRYAIETLGSPTRVTRERTLPTDHSHAALPGTPEQPANISVTRRRRVRPSAPCCLRSQARERPPPSNRKVVAL